MRLVNVNNRAAMYDVYIGRGTKWGNPYIIGQHGTREEVVAKYESHARWRFTDDDLRELRHKVLGCHCYPNLCHGMILLKLLYERWPADFITDPLTHMTSEL